MSKHSNSEPTKRYLPQPAGREEVDPCKNCNTMKHLDGDNLCGRCAWDDEMSPGTTESQATDLPELNLCKGCGTMKHVLPYELCARCIQATDNPICVCGHNEAIHYKNSTRACPICGCTSYTESEPPTAPDELVGISPMEQIFTDTGQTYRAKPKLMEILRKVYSKGYGDAAAKYVPADKNAWWTPEQAHAAIRELIIEAEKKAWAGGYHKGAEQTNREDNHEN